MNLINKIIGKSIGYLSLFLLFFIPLYPKLPLVDIKNTWVYIRVEDFVVLFVILAWFYLLFKKRVTLKTPLTIPILVFWLIGAIATIHGVVVIFPTLPSVFPNVALLAFLRHIEYLSLFFVAFTSVKSKKFVIASIWTLGITLLLITLYGFGQKYLSLPAYLTMNEEYAKGIPIIISPLNRVSSTFAGHYDLAAYLVLVIPILVSLSFGFKNLFAKAGLLATSFLGVLLLFLTVSRVSFFALFAALFAIIFFNKKKYLLFLIPIVCLMGVVVLMKQSSLLARFGNTVKEVNVLVDAKSGADIGQVRFESRDFLKNKLILNEDINEATPSAVDENIIYEPDIPPALAKYRLGYELGVVEAEVTSTGETLPQGSGYINLSLAPVTKRVGYFFYEYPPDEASTSSQIRLITGDFLVKRAAAYDLSFTTRFQGEWPHALMAFGRNLFFGSGYGSVSLAVDNNYFRMLGETGLLGTLSFAIIFIAIGLYLKKVLPSVDSPVIRSLIFGFVGGVIGLSLNATLIDVFEASKVAFVLWLLTGFVVGAASLYQTKSFNLYKELLKAATSPIAVVIYLLILTVAIFSTTLSGYFIGDDFTWFRWASECRVDQVCGSTLSQIYHYFTNSDGFFYRPGTKTYFLGMYPLFWLNQVVYHLVSISAHFIVVILLYTLARKILKSDLLAAASAFIFLVSAGYVEIILWISSTGHLFNAIFILLSLLAFIKWDESKRWVYLLSSIVLALCSLAFYEIGIITPFLAIAYKVSKSDLNFKSLIGVLKNKLLALLFLPDLIYLFVRYTSNTFWFSGDYSYNLLKLPFNIIGNAFGYILISVFGPLSYSFYDKLREVARVNIPFAIIFGVILLIILYFGFKLIFQKISGELRKIFIFSLLFFLICLIPYLGLGNITFRYSYLASFGVIMITVTFFFKVYEYLKQYGRDIAVVSMSTIFAVFCLLHIIQAQQTMIEWRGAGDMVEKFLISLDSLYQSSWSKGKVDLYFANVPIKHGIAWVFPVGLDDAVWFAFKNDDIMVHQVPDIKSAPVDVLTSKTKWLFEFQPDGSLKHITLDKKESE